MKNYTDSLIEAFNKNYYNIVSYIDACPKDPCGPWLKRINSYILLDNSFVAQAKGQAYACSIRISLEDRDFDRCPLFIILEWNCEGELVSAVKSRITDKPRKYRELYSNELDHPTTTDLNDELNRLLNAAENICTLSQAIEIIEDNAKKNNRKYYRDSIDPDVIQSIIYYDFPINTDMQIGLTFNIALENSIMDLLIPKEEAPMYVDCYGELETSDGVPIACDNIFDVSKTTTAIKLHDQVEKIIDYAMRRIKRINTYKQNIN